MAIYRYKQLFSGKIVVQKRFLYFFWKDFYPKENDLDTRKKKLNDLARQFEEEYNLLKKEEKALKALCDKISKTGQEFSPPFAGPSWPINRKALKPIVGNQPDDYMKLAKALKGLSLDNIKESGGIIDVTTSNSGAIAKAIKPEDYQRGKLPAIFQMNDGNSNKNKRNNNNGNHNNQGSPNFSPVN